jgi:hypothetical protein
MPQDFLRRSLDYIVGQVHLTELDLSFGTLSVPLTLLPQSPNSAHKSHRPADSMRDEGWILISLGWRRLAIASADRN